MRGPGFDVQKLKGSENEYRLRIGNYRVLFELEGHVATCMLLGMEKKFTDDYCRFKDQARARLANRQTNRAWQSCAT
jgi:mRNA-degrading endonuclease RelE of RelBE toxin-antitoxin system